jgi:hypothetical protein
MVINRGDEAAVAKHPLRREETNIWIKAAKHLPDTSRAIEAAKHPMWR